MKYFEFLGPRIYSGALRLGQLVANPWQLATFKEDPGMEAGMSTVVTSKSFIV